MNGDGRADLVFRDDATGQIKVCLGEPDGAGWRFGAPVVWEEWGELRLVYTSLNHLKGELLQRVGVDLVDMNGDGLPDYVETTPDG